MKPPLLTLLATMLIAATPAPVLGAEMATAIVAAPTAITGIRTAGKDLEVTAHVPAGQRRVTLEARPHAQGGSWTPRAVKWSGGALGELKFTLPLGDGTEVFRVRDESEAELGVPASFFAGLKTFAPTAQTEAATTAGTSAPATALGVSSSSPSFTTATFGSAFPIVSAGTDGQIFFTSGPLSPIDPTTDQDQPGSPVSSAAVDRVFVLGDRLLQLREQGGLPPQITLTQAATPATPLATLPLKAVPVVGADLRDGRLFVVQSQADSWSNAPVVTPGEVVSAVPQPPLRETVTNLVVETVQPPPLISYVMFTNVIHFPPIPGDTNPPLVLTNIFERKIFTTQPSYLVTNSVVEIQLIPQPPLFTTNWYSRTNWVQVPVPGGLQLSVVEAGSDSLTLAGRTKLANPTNYYGSPLVAHWPQAGVVVWVERDGVSAGYIQSKVALTLRGSDLDLTAGAIAWVGNSTPYVASYLPVFWGGFNFLGTQTRMFLAFDVTDVANPRLVSTTRLGEAGGWSGFSDTFVAEGKLFVSHDVSKYVAPTNSGTPVGNPDGGILFLNLWQPGTWEQQHFLDVLDFTDVTNPVVRAPVDFPGTLQGVSHQGVLVYAAGQNPTNTQDTATYLHALAYDGVQASLVASLRRPALMPQPLLVRADGAVLLGVAAATTNDVSALETWAVSTEGGFERYATVPLTAPAEELHAFGDLLVVPAAGAFQFFDATDAAALRSLGSGDRASSLWFDWNAADASAATGLWVPRGDQGLWNVPIHP